jgi:hypothetical protein
MLLFRCLADLFLKLIYLLVFESQILPQGRNQRLKLILMNLFNVALLLNIDVLLRKYLVSVLKLGDSLIEPL